MAKEEQDREDLLREATVLVDRIELMAAGETVVVGFRTNGAASLFFGVDPVYQFNAAGELRRAFAEGLLYKAERGRLVRLRRERSESGVALVRSELSVVEEQLFLAQAQGRIQALAKSMEAGQVTIVGQVPADQPIAERVQAWIGNLAFPLKVAATARVS